MTHQTNMSAPNHSDRDHAEFSPSSLKYVAACPAYEGKSGTSAAAAKGTRIHEALEVRDPTTLLNDEEVEIYEQIVKMEEIFMDNFSGVAEEHNEIQVTVQLDGTETWGTCDRFLILKNGDAVMADYKTGVSKIDPPEENWQAKAYVLGAFQKFDKIDKITFAFYVPIHEQTLYHTFHRSDMDSLREQLTKVILAGEVTRPKWGQKSIDIDDCNPSQFCRFCAHEEHCPALGGMALDVCEKLGSGSRFDVHNFDDPDNLSELFRIAKVLESWVDLVKSKAVKAAKDGVVLDGLVLKSMGRSKNITDNQTFLKVAETFGLTSEELLDTAKFSLSKVAKLASADAYRKEKRQIENNFVDACEEAGIVELSDERFTLVSHAENQ